MLLIYLGTVVTAQVIPAKAGIQWGTQNRLRTNWIPAFAGMTASEEMT